jgi:hypothetical protein
MKDLSDPSLQTEGSKQVYWSRNWSKGILPSAYPSETYGRPCRSLGGESPDFHRGGTGWTLGHIMWDLWWTKGAEKGFPRVLLLIIESAIRRFACNWQQLSNSSGTALSFVTCVKQLQGREDNYEMLNSRRPKRTFNDFPCNEILYWRWKMYVSETYRANFTLIDLILMSCCALITLLPS